MMRLLFFLLLISSLAFGTASTPVTVSSVTVSSGTVTVTTSAAHNIPSNNPGFCLQGSSVTADVLCATALTVPSSTTFTFSSTVQSSSSPVTACSSSCGTAQPAKNFIIMGDPYAGQLGQSLVSYCQWTYMSSGLPIAGKTTACAAFETNSTLLTSENAALASGAWVETVVTIAVPLNFSRGSIENLLQGFQFSAQEQLAGTISIIQPGRDSLTFCDAVGCNQ